MCHRTKMLNCAYMISLLVLVISCNPTENDSETPERDAINQELTREHLKTIMGIPLTWKGFDGTQPRDPEEAVYFFGGERIGQGSEGFAKLIEVLKNLPRDTRIALYPDDLVVHLLGDLTDFHPLTMPEQTMVPFRKEGKLDKAFVEAAEERRLGVIHYPANPYTLWIHGTGAKPGDPGDKSLGYR